MSHPLVLALFESPSPATEAARALRQLGVPHERVSIVARSHDEEGAIARASGASPGSELEDSAIASRLGELSAHFLAAIALVVPGVGPIVADGPLAARLAEVAGHAAGGIAPTLERAGLDRVDAEQWEARVREGSVLVGAHVAQDGAAAARDVLTNGGAQQVADLVWTD